MCETCAELHRRRARDRARRLRSAGLPVAKPDAWQRFRERRLRAGICVRCRRPARRNRALCARHLAADRERSKTYRAKRAKGRCVNCGGPAVRYWRCVSCRVADAARKRERRRGDAPPVAPEPCGPAPPPWAGLP